MERRIEKEENLKIKEVLSEVYSENVKVLRRSEIREILKLTRKEGIISFAGGLPSPELFPVEEMKDVVKTVLEREGKQALQYGPTEGDPVLIDFIVRMMNENEGAHIDSSYILIVSGAQQALDLVGKLFINPGDNIIVGLPTYLGALQAFRGYRANFIGVQVDKQGMNVDEVERVLKEMKRGNEKVKFIYVVPDFQNPAGVTMTYERRKKLIELAEDYNTIIVEDSPYRELRFEGEPVPMIGAMDKKGYVISIHTFSKILAPGMRLGWIIANPVIIEKMVMAKQPLDLCSPPFGQSVVAEFCNRGLLKPHIERIIKHYKKKRDIMLEALDRYIPKDMGVDWTEPEGGLFLWITLPDHLDAEELFPKAVEKKVAYVVGSAFHFDRSGRNTMRINFSYPSEEQIEEGIKRLAELFKENI